jgi:hypothetical protein
VATVVNGLEGGAEPAGRVVEREVVAAIVHPHDRTASLQERGRHRLEEGLVVEVAAHAVVEDHHVHRQPQGARRFGQSQRPFQANAIGGDDPDQLDVHINLSFSPLLRPCTLIPSPPAPLLSLCAGGGRKALTRW